MLRRFENATPKVLNIKAQGEPSDAVARRHPGLLGHSCPAVENCVIPRIALLPRPKYAARRFGLGMLAINGAWILGRSVKIRQTQGGTRLA